MSTRTRLARLERLERSKGRSQSDYTCPGFVIAPKVAREIVDDYQRLDDAISNSRLRRWFPTEEPDPAAEERAAARLAEHLQTIQCPPDYWRNQADTDRRFLEGGGRVWDEYAQVKARQIVFDGSPDGVAWRRLMDLSYRKRTRAEQAELDQLHRRYPGMPLKDYNPFYETLRASEESIREAAANGLIELTEPIESYYKNKNALWERVDRYRSGRR
jgi:hypothetical protein